MAKRTEDGGKRLDFLAEKLVTAAMEGQSGWMDAVQEIANRMDGKAHQSTDITVTDDRMVVNAPPPEENTEEWLRKYGPNRTH